MSSTRGKFPRAPSTGEAGYRAIVRRVNHRRAKGRFDEQDAARDAKVAAARAELVKKIEADPAAYLVIASRRITTLDADRT